MNDWSVLWLMVAVVCALWWIGLRARARHQRRWLEEWESRYGPRRGGPPRVVP